MSHSFSGATVNIQQRLLSFVTRTNWVLLVLASLAGTLVHPDRLPAGSCAAG